MNKKSLFSAAFLLIIFIGTQAQVGHSTLLNEHPLKQLSYDEQSMNPPEAHPFPLPFFYEDFESGSELPVGWNVINGGDLNGWGILSFGGGFAHSGSGFATISSSNSQAHDDYLVLPSITVEAGSNDLLSFWVRNFDASALDAYEVRLSTTVNNDPSAFSILLENQYAPGITWEEKNIDLSDYVNQTIYIAIRAISFNKYVLGVDDVELRGIPTCPKPTNFTLNENTPTEATFSWTNGGSETVWKITYGVLGFDPTTEGTEVSVSTNPVTISDLIPGTYYQFYLQSDCGDGNLSPSVFPIEVYTGYCIPHTSYARGDGITNVTFGQGASIVNNTTGEESNNYGNYAALIGDAAQNSSLEVNITYSMFGNRKTKIWVDWNNDFDFDDNGEMVYTLIEEGSSTSVLNANFDISETVPLGHHRMRIVYSRQGDINPCYTGQEGCIEDYTINVIPPQGCPQPTNFSADNITNTEITFSWTSGGNETAWNLIYGTPGFNPATEGTSIHVTSNTATISDLSVSTNYEVYLQADCGEGDLSFLTIPLNVMTSGYCVPNPNNVDGEGIVNVTFGNEEAMVNNTTGTEPNNYGNYTSMIGNVAQTSLLNVGITYQTLNYQYHTKIWVDWNNNLSFEDPGEEVYVGQAPNGSPSVLNAYFEVPVTVPLGQYRMRIGGSYYDFLTSCDANLWACFEDYTINVTSPPGCQQPTDFVLDATTEDGATFSWTSIGTETAWNLIYGIPGFDPETEGTTVSVTSNPASITGLSTGTDYEIYLQADCGDGELSLLTYKVEFTTACGAYTPEYTQSFTEYLPNCWEEAKGAINGYVYSESSSWYQGGLTSNDTSKMAKIYLIGTGYKEWLITPEFDLSGGGYELQYDIALRGTGSLLPDNLGGDNMVKVIYTENGTDWVTLKTYDANISISNNLQTENIDISTITGTHVKFAFWSSCGTESNPGVAFCLDNFKVKTGANCLAPAELSVNSVTSTEVTLSWTSGGATAWNIIYGIEGFNPTNEGTSLSVTNNTVTISNLSPEMVYQFYLQTDCGDGNLSALSSAISVYTGYCTPSPQSVDGKGITNVRFGQGASTVNNTTEQETDNYGNYTSMIGDAAQTSQLTVAITYETNFTYNTKIWVDWNNDLDFDDEGEEVYTGVSSEESPAILMAYFEIPETVSLGHHRMRIIGADVAVPTPCYSGNWACAEDYTINVTPPPSCLSPDSFTLVSKTYSEATFTWTSVGEETAWNLIYGISGFDPTTEGTSISVTENSATITGLTAETEYQVYLQADCGNNDVSLLTEPLNVYTGYCIPDAYIPGNGITNVTFGQGTSIVDNTTQNEPNDYGNYASMIGDAQQNTSLNVSVTINSYSSSLGVKIFVDWNNDFDFDDAGEEVYESLINNSEVFNAYFEIPETASLGHHRMRIVGSKTEHNDACDFVTDGCAEDYTINVIPLQDCVQPSNLTLENLDGADVTLSWTNGGDETAWNLIYGIPGFNPLNEGTSISVTNNPTTINILTTETHYQVYLQADCGNGNLSPLTPPLDIYTEYCTPETYSVDGSGITNVTFGQGTSIVNNTTEEESNNYGNYTSMIGDAKQSSELNVNITYDSPNNFGIKIWVDWNNDLDFYDAGENVYTETSASNALPVTLNAHFTIPSTATLGHHRMRIVGSEQGDNDACYSGFEGCSEDYTINVTPPPSCPAPSDLTLDDITTTEATFSWVNGGTETAWNLIYGAPGFNPETEGTRISVTSNPATITGLSPETEYQIYLQADCGNGDESLLSSQISFTTLCASISSLPYEEGFESGVFPPNCWRVFRGDNNLGDNQDWNSSPFGNGDSGHAAKVLFEDVDGGNAEDWLVSPRITLPSVASVLSFYQKQSFSLNKNSSYSIKISTSSQIDKSTFVDVVTYGESEFTTSYTQKEVSLDDYLGQSVYIAFVMTNDDGDAWYIDDIRIDGTDNTPVADFTVENEVCENTQLSFTDASSYNNAWIWNFGDGTSEVTEQNPTHTYVTAGTYTVTLTVQNTDFNLTDTKTQSITVVASPNAGNDATLTICEGSTITEEQLFALLGDEADANGTWTPELAGAGTYTYTVSATAPCTEEATAQVIVTEQASPNAGNDATLTICEGSTVTAEQLFALLGDEADANGTWTPELAGAGTYTYTVQATAPCTEEATSQVIVMEQALPNAGNDASLTICEGSTVTAEQLFALLGDEADANGTWTPELVGAGTYTYTVQATSPCTENATAQVEVTEQAQANAGNDAYLDICEGTVPTEEQLFNALGGTPDEGGVWIQINDSVYTYTVDAMAPCTESNTSKITIREITSPDAGTDGALTICEGTMLTNEMLFASLGGNPNAGGVWSNDGLTYFYIIDLPCGSDTAIVMITEVISPNAGTDTILNICEGTTLNEDELFASLGGNPDAGGVWTNDGLVYTYTVMGDAPCADATAVVTLNEVAEPNAGNDATLTICEGSTVTAEQLFVLLGDEADANGTWTPELAGAGTYTYTVLATAPCSDATAQVEVTEQAQADAGNDAYLDICEGIVPTEDQLFNALGGTPDEGGVWIQTNDSVYTYTVDAIAPCTENSIANITVREITFPNAGTDGVLTICEGTIPTDEELFASLGGTPNVGGVWTNNALVYTYIVNLDCGSDTAIVTVTEVTPSNAGNNGTLEVCEGTIPSEAELFNVLGENAETGGVWTNDGLVYTYTLTNDVCGDATATVTLTEIALPVANFAMDVSNLPTVILTNESTNADSYTWSLGDGTTLTTIDVEHTYTENGTYNIHLTSTNVCGVSNYESMVTIVNIGVPYLVKENVKLYPNPAKDYVKIDLGDNYNQVKSITIIDDLGKKVLNIEKVNQRILSLPIQGLASGIYLVNILTNNERIVLELVVL